MHDLCNLHAPLYQDHLGCHQLSLAHLLQAVCQANIIERFGILLEENCDAACSFEQLRMWLAFTQQVALFGSDPRLQPSVWRLIEASFEWLLRLPGHRLKVAPVSEMKQILKLLSAISSLAAFEPSLVRDKKHAVLNKCLRLSSLQAQVLALNILSGEIAPTLAQQPEQGDCAEPMLNDHELDSLSEWLAREHILEDLVHDQLHEELLKRLRPLLSLQALKGRLALNVWQRLLEVALCKHDSLAQWALACLPALYMAPAEHLSQLHLDMCKRGTDLPRTPTLCLAYCKVLIICSQALMRSDAANTHVLENCLNVATQAQSLPCAADVLALLQDFLSSLSRPAILQAAQLALVSLCKPQLSLTHALNLLGCVIDAALRVPDAGAKLLHEAQVQTGLIGLMPLAESTDLLRIIQLWLRAYNLQYPMPWPQLEGVWDMLLPTQSRLGLLLNALYQQAARSWSCDTLYGCDFSAQLLQILARDMGLAGPEAAPLFHRLFINLGIENQSIVLKGPHMDLFTLCTPRGYGELMDTVQYGSSVLTDLLSTVVCNTWPSERAIKARRDFIDRAITEAQTAPNVASRTPSAIVWMSLLAEMMVKLSSSVLHSHAPRWLQLNLWENNVNVETIFVSSMALVMDVIDQSSHLTQLLPPASAFDSRQLPVRLHAYVPTTATGTALSSPDMLQSLEDPLLFHVSGLGPCDLIVKPRRSNRRLRDAVSITFPSDPALPRSSYASVQALQHIQPRCMLADKPSHLRCLFELTRGSTDSLADPQKLASLAATVLEHVRISPELLGEWLAKDRLLTALGDCRLFQVTTLARLMHQELTTGVDVRPCLRHESVIAATVAALSHFLNPLPSTGEPHQVDRCIALLCQCLGTMLISEPQEPGLSSATVLECVNKALNRVLEGHPIVAESCVHLLPTLQALLRCFPRARAEFVTNENCSRLIAFVAWRGHLPLGESAAKILEQLGSSPTAPGPECADVARAPTGAPIALLVGAIIGAVREAPLDNAPGWLRLQGVCRTLLKQHLPDAAPHTSTTTTPAIKSTFATASTEKPLAMQTLLQSWFCMLKAALLTWKSKECPGVSTTDFGLVFHLEVLAALVPKLDLCAMTSEFHDLALCLTTQFLYALPDEVSRSEPTCPKCVMRDSRAAAGKLLRLLLAHDEPGQKTTVAALVQFHSPYFHDPEAANALADIELIAAAGYCGLQNLGATCYMNAFLQQLFFMPAFCARLLAIRAAPESQDSQLSAPLPQLQDLFVELKYSIGRFVPMHELCAAYTDMAGQPINPREQVDVDEFMNQVSL
ncbi:uncharacterized protein MONBRDRAFT_23829 [Monosiga brevicollis MX1]|uniref:USP domain-containing protein n=1 Tax=Monosiga brevicollis TaxID=81824 RepID=A9UUY6_MONBE|nr:uncharacterized protein MONBRDRAFT_23829 [Monosiga brevicollis MX1]EDQ90991.1 predicted protein [Monosiga brevicollis MX1]|eukprot:XP_001744288.1 hypothetical protein [Monosiga brevicollis MX1]